MEEDDYSRYRKILTILLQTTLTYIISIKHPLKHILYIQLNPPKFMRSIFILNDSST